MTVREFVRELVVGKDTREEAHDRDVTLAWSIAAMTRGSKGLPKLNSLLIRKQTPNAQPQRQSLAEMQHMLEAISQAYQIPLRKGAAHG